MALLDQEESSTRNVLSITSNKISIMLFATNDSVTLGDANRSYYHCWKRRYSTKFENVVTVHKRLASKLRILPGGQTYVGSRMRPSVSLLLSLWAVG
jgi:hypothetical protein